MKFVLSITIVSVKETCFILYYKHIWNKYEDIFVSLLVLGNSQLRTEFSNYTIIKKVTMGFKNIYGILENVPKHF